MYLPFSVKVEILSFFLRIAFSRLFEVRKVAKIRNRYNQAPHLDQDTNGKVTKTQ